ncbi:MAG: hypothetical protein JW913_10460 [Chitinispirillaceae bacterium]|nr:hypothetical protein [Chitinispirillaceae bacterium]
MNIILFICFIIISAVDDSFSQTVEIYPQGPCALETDIYRTTTESNSWCLIKPVYTGGKRLLLFYDRLSNANYGTGSFRNADDYSLVKNYSRLKETWQDIIPMDIDGDGNDELVFYDFKNSLFQIWFIDGNARCEALGMWNNSYLGKIYFRQIMPVQWDPDAASELFFYSDDGNYFILKYQNSDIGFSVVHAADAPSSKFVQKITFPDNTSGYLSYDPMGRSVFLIGADFSLKVRQDGWYQGWTDIVTGNFGSGKEFGDILFYDRVHGTAAYYNVGNDGLLLNSHSAGYRKTWSIITPIHPDPASSAGCADRLLYYEKLDNAELAVPSYNGMNQAVHPDVVAAGPGQYTMVYTPYPFHDDAFENPSILTSNDGFNFTVLTNGRNDTVGFPVCRKPNPFSIWDHAWNNDPDILYEDDIYYIVYQESYYSTERGFKFENIVLVEADDRFNDMSFTRIEGVIGYKDIFSLSPSLIRIGTRYYMFFVNCDTDQIRYMSTDDIYSWPDIAHSTAVNLGKNGANFHPWHIDIVSNNDTAYYLLISGHFNPAGTRYDDNDLYIAESTDLTNWTLSKKPVIDRFTWGYSNIYRSTGIMTSRKKMTIWFSFNKSLQTGIGIKKEIAMDAIEY